MSRPLHIDPFYQAIDGRFVSMMKWSDLDNFWDMLRGQADKGWYIYAVGETPPTEKNSADQVLTFIQEIDILLRKDHQEEYCGIVYTDSKSDPMLIKIFDPNNLGVSCGFSDNPPPPGWVMSLIAPQVLDNNPLLPKNRKTWWQKLWE